VLGKGTLKALAVFGLLLGDFNNGMASHDNARGLA
jgi:hypothetical protein